VRYARGIDRHDDELILSAFHDDALDQHGDVVRTPTELVAWGNSTHVRTRARFWPATSLGDGIVATSPTNVRSKHRRHLRPADVVSRGPTGRVRDAAA
jgi:hypothetical protein